MSVRSEVLRLVALGPLPDASQATESDLKLRAEIIEAIHPPISREEADALLGCFGGDDCFGIAWTLLHLLETTPGGAVRDAPRPDANEWVHRLWARAHR